MVRFEAAFDFEKAENLKCFKFEKLEKISLTCLITLIEKIGGRIEVESEPGKGSTFKCMLNK
jgi:light-regulated signal transduction histidine kinase (bacteriophytochrome)